MLLGSQEEVLVNTIYNYTCRRSKLIRRPVADIRELLLLLLLLFPVALQFSDNLCCHLI
jgi:hypothetical protein